jgi:hypothetical protein
LVAAGLTAGLVAPDLGGTALEAALAAVFFDCRGLDEVLFEGALFEDVPLEGVLLKGALFFEGAALAGVFDGRGLPDLLLADAVPRLLLAAVM